MNNSLQNVFHSDKYIKICMRKNLVYNSPPWKPLPMKTISSILFVLVAFALSVVAAQSGHASGQHMHVKQLVKASTSQHEDVRKHNFCPHCGMDREKYSHSRILITYSDGFSVGVCSIHCAAIELKASKAKVVRSIEVADFQTGKLIPAEKAVWVIGGIGKGVMTVVPKWAFSILKAARTFIQKNGGTLGTYQEVLSRAEKD